MIRRLWIVVSASWSLLFWGVVFSSRNIGTIDWFMIALPWIVGILIWYVGRWVVHGTPG